MRDKQGVRSTVIPCRFNAAELRLLNTLVKKTKSDRSVVIRSALLDMADEVGVDERVILAACGPRVSEEGTVKS